MNGGFALTLADLERAQALLDQPTRFAVFHSREDADACLAKANKVITWKSDAYGTIPGWTIGVSAEVKVGQVIYGELPDTSKWLHRTSKGG